MRIVELIFALVFIIRRAQGFVFSCEEVKYKLVNTVFEESTRYVCLVPQDGFSGINQLMNIYAQADKVSTSFAVLLNAQCIERPNESSPWRIVADLPVDLDCTQEFSLIFTSSQPNINVARQEAHGVFALDEEEIFVSPVTGMEMYKYDCSGDGDVTIYTGAGNGVAEFRYPMVSWRCADFPDWIFTFDNVITIVPEKGVRLNVGFDPHSTDNVIAMGPDVRIAVMTSGRSDNLQNYHAERNFVMLTTWQDIQMTGMFSGSFDARYDNYVNVLGDSSNGKQWTRTFRNETTSMSTVSTNFKVLYVSTPVDAPDLWDNQDNFVLVMDFTALPQPPTTPAPVIGEGMSTVADRLGLMNGNFSDGDPYCGCELDNKFGMPVGWDPTGIWLDIVIILDCSEAMGKNSLVEASSLIQSFFGAGDYDVLITDSKAQFYNRVGLIAMSDVAETIYNLNMTKGDKVNVSIKTGVKQINVLDAFDAAQQMLQDGQTPGRSNARQVIYYMTDSDPKVDLTTIESFKQEGVIIVNDFIDSHVIERPGLKDLASDGYYYTDIQDNYMSSIQLFCKANCFCSAEADHVPYSGHNKDDAVEAAGGCFHVAPAGVPYNSMIQICTELGGGQMVSIHDDDKALFVNNLYKAAKLKPDYYWIGYTKSDDLWIWTDKSANPYARWDADEPSKNTVANCAYVDSTSTYWGAANCNVGYPSVCEFKPCAVGNKNC